MAESATRRARGIIDTSVVIDLEKLDSAVMPVELAVTALTMAELAAGPHAATEPDERARRQDRLQRAEAAFDPLPFDDEAARAYGRVYAAVVGAGRKARGHLDWANRTPLELGGKRGPGRGPGVAGSWHVVCNDKVIGTCGKRASTPATCQDDLVATHEQASQAVTARRGTSPTAAPPAGGSPLFSLQRSIGNQAFVELLSPRSKPTKVVRKIAKSLDPTTSGPNEEIADSALSGDQQTRAADTLTLIKSGIGFDDHPWVKERASQNAGKVPSSVKKSMKWKWPHRNNAGHLPGVKGAGGYDEYYINTGALCAGPPTETERMVVSTSTNDVFHTATHYGDKGKPAFTHFGTTK